MKAKMLNQIFPNILIMTALILTTILLIGCSNTTTNICPKIEPIKILPPVDIRTNDEGGLDRNNTAKVFVLIKKLREKEKYYNNTIEKYNQTIWRNQ